LIIQPFELLRGLFAGTLLGFSIAVPPGPVNATVAREVASKHSAFAGFAVAVGATTADGIFLLLTYLGWTEIVARSGVVIAWIYLIGALVMISYAFLTLRQLALRAPPSSSRQFLARVRDRLPYLLGLSLGLTNPYQIAWWLSVGIASISSFGPTVIAGFFLGIMIWNSVYATGLKAGTVKIAGFEKIALVASSMMLLGFGAWFLYNAVPKLI
jgi:threonine/homoserine/homoserine lactone efflux protein